MLYMRPERVFDFDIHLIQSFFKYSLSGCGVAQSVANRSTECEVLGSMIFLSMAFLETTSHLFLISVLICIISIDIKYIVT